MELPILNISHEWNHLTYDLLWLAFFFSIGVIFSRYMLPHSICWLHFLLLLLSRVQLFATSYTVAHQAPLSLGFPKQEYWSGFPFFSPGDFSWPRGWTCVSCMADRFFTTELPGKSIAFNSQVIFHCMSTCIHSSVYDSYFCFLAIMNFAAVNFHVHIFVWTCVFISLGYILKILLNQDGWEKYQEPQICR